MFVRGYGILFYAKSKRDNSNQYFTNSYFNYNRHYAEHRGYWRSTDFVEEATKEYAEKGKINFYDSNTGNLLFIAPKGRSFDEFINESMSHGWPSFRDEEVVWDDVRCLPNGEAVSLVGTHLGVSIVPKGYCASLDRLLLFLHVSPFVLTMAIFSRIAQVSRDWCLFLFCQTIHYYSCLCNKTF